MSRNLSEGNINKDVAANEFGTRQLFRRPAQKFKIVAVYHIKVRGNRQRLIIRNDEFTWAIEEDIAGMELQKVEIDVTTPAAAGTVEVKLRNIDNGDAEMLSTHATIDPGDTHSLTAASQPVVNPANAGVSHGDRIAIDVIDNGGTDARGLGLVAYFSAPVP